MHLVCNGGLTPNHIAFDARGILLMWPPDIAAKSSPTWPLIYHPSPAVAAVDSSAPNIITPHALPLFQKVEKRKLTKRQMERVCGKFGSQLPSLCSMDCIVLLTIVSFLVLLVTSTALPSQARMDPVKTKIPERPFDGMRATSMRVVKRTHI